jgi:putative transposase
MHWVALYRWSAGRWRGFLRFVSPETVIKWHKLGYRHFWRWRSRPGRPEIGSEVIHLIAELSLQNPSWGAKRIATELEKIGHDVATETVRKYMLTAPAPTSGPRRPSQSWSTFLGNQKKQILACDFLTQYTVAFKTDYVFVVMSLDRRTVLRAVVTDSPTLDWVKNLLRVLFAFEHPYRYLIHDNDKIFGQFGAKMKKITGVRCHLDHWLRGAMNIQGIPTPYHAPNANAFVERFNRSLREEALNHFIFLSGAHLQRVVDEYIQYYNEARPSQGLGAIPRPPPELRLIKDAPASHGKVIARPILGGLHHDYRRAA